MTKKEFITLILSFLALSFTTFAFAQTITLYDQPAKDAKVVGTADLSSGIIPIFTPEKNTEWMKVADPRNGNVGWIKSADIKNARGSENTVTFTQRIINNGSQPHSYQVIQFGNPPTKMSDEQVKAFVQKMQQQQEQMQQSFQSIIKNMNEAIKREWDVWNAQGGFPMIIVPGPAADQHAKPKTPAVPAPAKTTTPEPVKK